MLFDINSYIQQPLPFDKEIEKVFKKNDPLVIFEIGSCEGEDSIRLKRRFPNSNIYTFEPLEDNIKKIKKYFKQYGLDDKNVYKLALSDKDGSAEFYVSSGQPDNVPESEKSDDWDFGNKSSSLLPPKEHKKTLSWVKFNNKIKVKTQRLDNFCKKHKINKIDFIYLDVQGAELMVLKGAGDQLRKVRAIWLEVEAVELYSKQPLKKDVEEFMKKNDFEKIQDTVDNISGDQLYLNKHYAVSRQSWTEKIRHIVGA